MANRIGDSLLAKAKYVPLDTLGENDMFRFQNLQQWFTRCSWCTKMDFLRNILTITGDPLFWFMSKTVFKKAYTKDVEYTKHENNLAFDIQPTDDYDRSLDAITLKKMIDQDTDWYNGLTRDNRLVVFMKLMLLGGINIITCISKYIDELLFKSDEYLLSLDDLISKYTDEQNTTVTIYDYDMLTNERPFSFEKILTKANLSKNKAKITDAAYLEYIKKTEVWEKKLQTFVNKQKHLTTADPRVDTVLSSDINPLLSLKTSNTLNDVVSITEETDPVVITDVGENLTSVQHNISSHLKYTVGSTSEYKVARRNIDWAIERHIRKFQLQEVTKQIQCDTEIAVKIGNVDNIHLVNPSDDRRTKQAETGCVLKAARSKIPKGTLTKGFDTKIISMVPQEFCEDAQNYKMFPRSSTVQESTSINK